MRSSWRDEKLPSDDDPQNHPAYQTAGGSRRITLWCSAEPLQEPLAQAA
jgi:hypothetical protein